MLEFLLLLFLLILVLLVVFITIDRLRNKSNIPKSPPPLVYDTGLNPNSLSFPDYFYKEPPVSTVHLPEWAEPIAHNQLVDFGPYIIGIGISGLIIIDPMGGQHIITVSAPPRITYADSMVIYIETKQDTIILARGSPFITTNHPLPIKTDNGDLKPIWRPTLMGFTNLSILPDNVGLNLLLGVNYNVVIRQATFEKKNKLKWHTSGPDSLLLFVPYNDTVVGKPTNVTVKFKRGVYRLERGDVWQFPLNSFTVRSISDIESNIDRIVYDPCCGRLVDLDDPDNSIPRLLKWVENNKSHLQMGIINPILRFVYGIVTSDSFFAPHYGIDFYKRSIYTNNLKDIPGTEIIDDLMTLVNLYPETPKTIARFN